MRSVILALMVLTFASPAVAADADILRGSDVFVPPVPTPAVVGPPKPQYHWGGVYGGVQGGAQIFQLAITTFMTHSPSARSPQYI